MNAWYRARVLRGDQEGRTLGFPTINLSPHTMKRKEKEGVYACFVRYGDKLYKGVLFYGPRLMKKEKKPVLEIHILHFEGDMYGKTISFQLLSYIREVKHFTTIGQMKKEIEKDIKKTPNTPS